jgi:DNA-binding CsgD family transcriptional regulator
LLALLNDYKPVPSLFHYWQSLKQLLISAAENTINSPAAHHDSKQGQAHPAMATLTVREGEVLELLLQGKGNAEIAGELMLSQATIKGHVGRLLKKFAVLNRSQLIALQPR